MKELIKKHNSFFKYILVSTTTSIINILLYIALANIFNKLHILANVISWIITTLIIFILNKKIIFKDNVNNSKIAIKKIFSFYILRLTSLMIDTLILQFCIDYIKMKYIMAKIISNCGTILNNYLISKYYIFTYVY